jgi:hypothetical protein
MLDDHGFSLVFVGLRMRVPFLLFVPIKSYYLRRPSIPDGFGGHKIKRHAVRIY